MHDKLFSNQQDLSRDRLIQFSRELSLNQSVFIACLDARATAAEVAEDIRAGQETGVIGTPTFFINGSRVSGAIPEAVFKRLIEELAK